MAAVALRFTEVFADLYESLPLGDVEAVDRMLDELERRHDQPEMRNAIRVGDHTLFATPRIGARGGLYRITWQYDDRDRPSAIICLTVADIET